MPATLASHTELQSLYLGTCFCGAITVEASGSPEAMGYCHCASCRAWSAAPVTAFSLWQPEGVRVTDGVQHLASFLKTPASERQYCRKCGGHLMTKHAGLGLVDVYPAILRSLSFVPALHVNYAEHVLAVRDGLPKLKDFPELFAGTGETLPE